ncbi:MAG: tetratricopeptide repeat protein, partial [Bacteroidales bacterium]
DKNYSQAYYNRAVSNAILGNHKEALPDYDAAIIADPKNPEAYFNRGISRINLQDTKGGCEDFHKSLELGFKQAQQMINMYCPKNSN